MTDTFINPITIPELPATPSNPPSGFVKLYSKTDGKVYQLNAAGVETDLTATGGGGGATGPYAWMVQQSNYTLSSVTTTQKLFNVGTSGNGAVTLEAGIYMVRCQLYITGMSATSGNGTFDLRGAGTAVMGNSLRHSIGVDNTTPTNAATQTGAFSLNTNTNNLATNGTGTALAVTIQSLIEIATGGTVIPSIALLTASAAVVQAPSNIVFERISDTANATFGGTVN